MADRLKTINTTLGSPFQAGGALAANQSVNVSQINAVTPLMGNGVTGTGSQRVTIASDNTAFSVNAAQNGVWNVTNISGTVSLPTLASTSTKQSDGSQKTQIVDGSGNVIASTSNNLNVQCANCSGSGVSAADAATFTAGTSLFAPVGGQFTSGGATACVTGHECTVGMTAARGIFSDMASIAGTTTLTGNGTAGAGAQRVTIASDNTAFSVNATLQAAASTVIGTTRTLGNGGATMDAAVGGAAAPTNALVAGGVYNTSAPTLTNGQAAANQFDVNGNLKVVGTGIAIASTTSGQTGSLVMGAVTTSAPSYTTAQSNPLSLDTTGSLRINCTTGCSSSTAQQAPLNAGSATATNAGVVGGQFLTTQPTMTNTQQAAALLSTRGELLVSPGVSGFPVTISGSQSVNVAQVLGSAISATNGLFSNTLQGNAVLSTTNGIFANVLQGNAALTTANPIFDRVVAGSTGGSTTTGNIVANNTTAVVVKASAGTLLGVQVYGIGSAPAYLKIYNATSATCGSGTPVKRLMIPAASTAANGAGSNITFGDAGVNFGTGITYCVTTGIGDADTTAPAANTFLVNVDYQ